MPDSFPRRARAIPSCRGSRIYTLPLWCRTSDGVLLYSLVQRFCRPSWCPTECTSTWQLEKHPKGDFCGSSKNVFTLQVTKTLKSKWISKKTTVGRGNGNGSIHPRATSCFPPISWKKEPSTMDPACTCTMPKDICWSSRANVWFGYGPSFWGPLVPHTSLLEWQRFPPTVKVGMVMQHHSQLLTYESVGVGPQLQLEIEARFFMSFIPTKTTIWTNYNLSSWVIFGGFPCSITSL